MAEERGFRSTTGEPFVWALSVAPIFAVFTLLNRTWGAWSASHRERSFLAVHTADLAHCDVITKALSGSR
jgi:hypothetical protein